MSYSLFTKRYATCEICKVEVVYRIYNQELNKHLCPFCARYTKCSICEVYPSPSYRIITKYILDPKRLWYYFVYGVSDIEARDLEEYIFTRLSLVFGCIWEKWSQYNVSLFKNKNPDPYIVYKYLHPEVFKYVRQDVITLLHLFGDRYPVPRTTINDIVGKLSTWEEPREAIDELIKHLPKLKFSK